MLTVRDGVKILLMKICFYQDSHFGKVHTSFVKTNFVEMQTAKTLTVKFKTKPNLKETLM